MDRSLARQAAELMEFNDEAASHMFRHGFLCEGGSPSLLNAEIANEVAVEVVTFAATHPLGLQKRIFVMDRAELYGRQCAQAVANGEEWAVSRDMGWLVSVLRRHGVSVGK